MPSNPFDLIVLFVFITLSRFGYLPEVRSSAKASSLLMLTITGRRIRRRGRTAPEDEVAFAAYSDLRINNGCTIRMETECGILLRRRRELEDIRRMQINIDGTVFE